MVVCVCVRDRERGSERDERRSAHAHATHSHTYLTYTRIRKKRTSNVPCSYLGFDNQRSDFVVGKPTTGKRYYPPLPAQIVTHDTPLETRLRIEPPCAQPTLSALHFYQKGNRLGSFPAGTHSTAHITIRELVCARVGAGYVSVAFVPFLAQLVLDQENALL